MYAAAGWRMANLYAYNLVNSAYMSTNPAIQQAFSNVHDSLAGKTITYCAMMWDGSLKVKIQGNPSFISF